MKLADKLRIMSLDYAKEHCSDNYKEVIELVNEASSNGQLHLDYDGDLNEMDLILLMEIDGFDVEVKHGQRGIGRSVECFSVFKIKW